MKHLNFSTELVTSQLKGLKLREFINYQTLFIDPESRYKTELNTDTIFKVHEDNGFKQNFYNYEMSTTTQYILFSN